MRRARDLTENSRQYKVNRIKGPNSNLDLTGESAAGPIVVTPEAGSTQFYSLMVQTKFSL